MTRKRKGARLADFGPFDRTSAPVTPTSLIGVSPDGRLFAEDGSIWAYFAVPMGPTIDAKTLAARLAVSEPLIGASTELAAGTMTLGVKRRRVQRGNYRSFHILEVNVDAMFAPPATHPLRGMLERDFCSWRDIVTRRVVLYGVKLRHSVVSSSWSTTLERFTSLFQSGRGSLASTDEDYARVRAIMARWGMSTPTRDEMSLARAWWNMGKTPDTPYMFEPGRFHVFRSADAARRAAQLYEEKTPFDRWPPMDGHSVLSFASVTEFDAPDIDALDPRASWLLPVLNSGAVCVSVTGLLEPGQMTAREIERNKSGYELDVADAARKYGKEATPEQLEKIDALRRVRDVYSGGSAAAPSMVDVSIVIAFDGDGDKLATAQFPGIDVSVLTNRQMGAMSETWLAPTSRTNPMLHDMSLGLLAYSGVCSLSVVGDKPHGSAFVGYTELDRQPVWSNVAAAGSQADLPPLYGVFGESGSGKSMLMLWLTLQHAMLGHRTVYIDPKEGSDFTKVVEHYGGEVVSLSDIVGSNGILDPLRLTEDPADGIALAISMLAYIAPWGSSTRDMELPLTVALRAGVDRGAASILTALRRAREAGIPEATETMISTLEKYAYSVPFASALIGDEDDGPRLSFNHRFTMVRLGDMALNIDEAGGDLSARTTMSLVRMLVRGSTIAVRGEDGCVALDEAWIFFRASEAELDSLARLARSQRVSIYMGSQKVSDALAGDGDPKVPFSSGFILGMRRENEARAACKLLRIEPRAELLNRIMAPPILEATNGKKYLNYKSLRALIERDPQTNELVSVARGSVALYADVADRVVPTEVRLPDDFLALASTNPADRETAE